MRLIDADALINRIVFYTDLPFEIKEAVEDEINEQPTIEPEPHWIPCTERLPEIWDYVLCSQVNGDVGEGKLLDDGYWHICYDQSHRRKTWVVAWQPLPEKFKEEGDA